MQTGSSGYEHLARVREADLLIEDEELVARVEVYNEELASVLRDFLWRRKKR
jgi:hypothetical protein